MKKSIYGIVLAIATFIIAIFCPECSYGYFGPILISVLSVASILLIVKSWKENKKWVSIIGLLVMVWVFLGLVTRIGYVNRAEIEAEQKQKAEESVSKLNGLIVVPENPIQGELSNFIQIADKKYPLSISLNYSEELTVKCTVEMSVIARKNIAEYDGIDITMSLLDEQGNQIEKFHYANDHYEDSKNIVSNLKSGKGKSFVTHYSYVSLEDTNKIAKAKYVMVSAGIKKDMHKPSDSSYSNDDNSSSSSNNWDEILDSYEKYIDQYISLLKKAQNGDVSALSEYAKMLEKATDLAEKLENAGDDLTTVQMTRFVKLQAKLADAAMEMM